MERGPLALFGAIVAVGLGPAMWLGAQVAVLVAVPASGAPAAVTSPRDSSPAQPENGGAAGAATTDPTVVLQPTTHGHDQPMRDANPVSPSPRPRRTAPTPTATAAHSTSPPSTAPSTPPSEPTEASSASSASTDPPPSPPPSSTGDAPSV